MTLKLDGVDRYNPENIGSLEASVDAQCKQGSYDLNANLAILKLCVMRHAHCAHTTMLMHHACMTVGTSLTRTC